jgi:hypothetical protein
MRTTPNYKSEGCDNGVTPDQMNPPPIESLTIPMMITTMFRLRPAVLFDIAPNANPTTAMGTTIQFAQPSNGMKAGIARTRATKPMKIEIKLSIAPFRALQAIWQA